MTAAVDLERRAALRVALALFLLTSAVYALAAGGHTYSSDEEGLFATTRALVEHRNPTIVIDDKNNNVVPARVGRGGKLVSIGGLGQSVVAIPLYLAGSVAGYHIHGGNFGEYPERLFVGWTDALVTALGVALLFLLLERIGTERRWAVALALVYAFCTYVFPHAKTFFSEPLAATLSLGGLYFTVRSVQDRSVAAAVVAGASIGFALHARASVGLYVPILGLFLLWGWARPKLAITAVVRAAVGFGAGFAVPFALLLASNWWRFGRALDFGYESVPLGYPLQDGLYGLFLSPGKSVFLYAPVVALGLVATALVPRPHRPVAVTATVMGLANAVFFARFPYWHGDHTFGPRYLIMSIPFWVLPVGPLLTKRAWRVALGVAAAIGLAVALLGTVMYFNEYFAIAEQHAVPKLEILPDGPNYWRKMHYDPYWSPIAGTTRALPDVARNTWRRLDGHDRNLQEWPGTTNQKYGWYFAPPQVDSWVYWVFPTHGPKRFLLLAPLWVMVGAGGVVLLRRSMRT